MKQQSDTGSDGDELDFMKYRKYCDAFCEKSIPNTNNNRYSDANKVDEMQMTLKPYPNGWNETNSARVTSESAESPVYSNFFDMKNGLASKIMSPITSNTAASAAVVAAAPATVAVSTSSAFTSNDSLTHHEYYYLNSKPKFSGSTLATATQAKKPRLLDSRYELGEFHESTDSDGTTNQTDKLALQSEKSETVYENMHTRGGGGGEYQSNRSVQQAPTFAQSSAFHPPSFADNINKKSNSLYGSMSHMSSSYQYVDSCGDGSGGVGSGGGYATTATYTALDVNNSSNTVLSNSSPPEREQRSFAKVFAKDDDLNAHDYKEYTTLQPAGIGSKAASVIQDVARDGGAGSAVVINSSNSMSNSNVAQNTITTPSTTATNERTNFLLERPMAAFSPTNTTNKGKKKNYL